MSDEFGYQQKDEMAVGTPRWVPLAIVALAAVSILGLGVAWSATSHTRNVEMGISSQTDQNKAFQQGLNMLNQRLSQTEESNAQLQAELKLVTGKLKVTEGELTTARQQANKMRTDYSARLSTVQNQMATKADASDLSTLNGDVSSVKSDLENTKSNLQMAKGEFGTLIARNHDEIDQLRRIGERDYYEFSVNGKGQRAHAGNITLELRGVDVKKNQFTLALYVDDMRLEKKNRSVDEPIYFYMRGTRAPLELVINHVAKNQVNGYVSAPKSIQPPTTSAANGN